MSKESQHARHREEMMQIARGLGVDTTKPGWETEFERRFAEATDVPDYEKKIAAVRRPDAPPMQETTALPDEGFGDKSGVIPRTREGAARLEADQKRIAAKLGIDINAPDWNEQYEKRMGELLG